MTTANAIYIIRDQVERGQRQTYGISGEMKSEFDFHRKCGRNTSYILNWVSGSELLVLTRHTLPIWIIPVQVENWFLFFKDERRPVENIYYERVT